MTDIKNVIKLLASIMGYLGYYGIDEPLYKNYFCIKIIYWKEVKYIDIIAQSIHEKNFKIKPSCMGHATPELP